MRHLFLLTKTIAIATFIVFTIPSVIPKQSTLTAAPSIDCGRPNGKGDCPPPASKPGAAGSNTPANDAACNGLSQLGGTPCNSDAGKSAIGNVANRVVSITSYIAGIAAVIMIIISGFRYMTSGGDSANVSAAKTTLTYALIGIAVAALAQVMVHFVLNTTS